MAKRKVTEELFHEEEKATELPLTYVGPGFVGGTPANATLEARIAVACSERGAVLTKDTTGPTYGATYAHNGAEAVAAGSSLATIRTSRAPWIQLYERSREMDGTASA
jgi:hypothetical protein